MKNIINQMLEQWSSTAFIKGSKVLEWVEMIESELKKEKEVKSYEENWIEFCSNCSQKVSLKRRRIEKSMITALLKAIHYCNATNTKTFQKKNVKSLNPVEYTLISFLVKFWLLYKHKDMWPGSFGIPFKICSEFFKWERSVLEFYDIDPTKKEWEEWFKVNSDSRLYFKDIPKHKELVNKFPTTIEYLSNNKF